MTDIFLRRMYEAFVLDIYKYFLQSNGVKNLIYINWLCLKARCAELKLVPLAGEKAKSILGNHVFLFIRVSERRVA